MTNDTKPEIEALAPGPLVVGDFGNVHDANGILIFKAKGPIVAAELARRWNAFSPGRELNCKNAIKAALNHLRKYKEILPTEIYEPVEQELMNALAALGEQHAER